MPAETPDYRDPDAIREYVMDHMHYTGKRRHLLSNREWGYVYLNGDGFGPVTESFAIERLEWDWSHVRDSSDEAFLDMAAAIQSILRRRRNPNTVMNSRAYARNILGKNV